MSRSTTKGKRTKTSPRLLKTARARRDLRAQTRAYFVPVAAGAWLGYRKPLLGAGKWVARVGQGKDAWEKTLWEADDGELQADGVHVLSYGQAVEEVQKLVGASSRFDAAVRGSAALTLSEALDAYKLSLKQRGNRTYNATRPRGYLTDADLATPLASIDEKWLKAWCKHLSEQDLEPATVNRIMSCLRAALTEADKDRTLLWQAGLKAIPDATEANNVVIDDPAIAQRWVADSYALDHQLGLLTHVGGETGARPSQSVRLLVRDLVTHDMTAPRLLMPKSGKGGTKSPQQRKLERYSVSISPELAKLLKAAAKGRPSNAKLLLRSNGEPWDEEDPAMHYRRDVRKVVAGLGLDPDVYGLYAFRHTRITNMLLDKTPITIVAKSHDTSEGVIRKHYAASILDYTDDMTRKTLPSLAPTLA
jgi:hypothetical protein